MPASKDYTYAEVAKHNSKKDIYLIINDGVYNVSKFINEHPGGEEVLADVAGQDATQSFEDVSHSDEARQILSTLQIGKLKRIPGEGSFRATDTSTSLQHGSNTVGIGVGSYVFIVLAVALGFIAIKYI